MSKINIIIGLGFGDEGKGIMTDFVCSQATNPLVIRFNGGSQAGHTVNYNGFSHVFSNFGSGTFRGAPTYWSRFCALYPKAVLNEYDILVEKGFPPMLYVDGMCPVTTDYDIFFNQNRERKDGHGSCGAGFGATMKRNESPYKLYAKDLQYPSVVKLKLEAIRNYYGFSYDPEAENQFLSYCAEFVQICEIVYEATFLYYQAYVLKRDFVFEGAQGVLLDMDHGFFPHVTYSNTTSKNAVALMRRNFTDWESSATVNYVTRAYQTRHGNGPMTNENHTLNFNKNPKETNVFNEWQGNFRCTPLDLDLLKYAVDSDESFSAPLLKTLTITCVDQVPNGIQYTENGELKITSHPKVILDKVLKDGKLFTSHSPESKEIKKYGFN